MKLENNDQSFKVRKIGEMFTLDVLYLISTRNRDIKSIEYIS